MQQDETRIPQPQEVSFQKRHFADALKIKDVRLFLCSVGFFTLAARSLTVVIGFQIYKLTHTPLALEARERWRRAFPHPPRRRPDHQVGARRWARLLVGTGGDLRLVGCVF